MAFCAAVLACAADRGAVVTAAIPVEASIESVAADEAETGWVCQVDMSAGADEAALPPD